MKKPNILVLGNGLLGSELVKQTKWDCISRAKDGLDITDMTTYHKMLKMEHGAVVYCPYDVIVNCIANTDTYSKDMDSHWAVNYAGVGSLIEFCNKWNVKLVHISTDYIYSESAPEASETSVPVHCNNWYGYTKLLGDALVQLSAKNYLICRCTHKETPFQYENAWTNQTGNFDYVDRISNLIIKLIEKNKQGVYNVGTETKTMFDLARQTKNVKPSTCPVETPNDVTLNTSKLEKGLNPFFSIAIPTYGYEGRGGEFLDASFKILNIQTFKNFEIVVSDHSEDDTIKDVCTKWRNKLDIIYVKNYKGRGIISPNINNAMRHCNGDWIKVLFQDDLLYDANSLQVQHDFINEIKCSSWFMTDFYHSTDGHKFERPMTPVWNDLIWTGNNTMGCPSGMTIKNENILFFDETLNWLMDVDYYKSMFDKYGEPEILKNFTVVNRTWGNRLTDTISQDLKDREFKMLRKKYA